jgi:hypothetical protein
VKEFRKTAISLILCGSTVLYSCAGLAIGKPSDSTFLNQVVNLAPTFQTGTTVYGACFNNAAGGVTVTDPLGTQNTPYHLQLGNAVNITYLALTSPIASNTILSNGYYYITLNLVLSQQSATPVYYWVDDWASTQDVSGTTIATRIFYSGDVPYTLNSGANTASTVMLSGIAYLKKGSTIISPRVWAIPDAASGAPASFCIEGSGFNADGDSTFSASLLNSP